MVRRAGQGGFTLLEALLGVALLAILLAAVAAAMHAAMLSYNDNDRVAAVTQSARWALSRMMTEVRTADAVDCSSSQLSIIPPDDGSGLQLIQYTCQNGVLSCSRKVNGVTTTYAMLGQADNVAVQAFAVNKETAQRQGQTYTRSVTARLQIAVGNEAISVTASTAPRRNQDY